MHVCARKTKYCENSRTSGYIQLDWIVFTPRNVFREGD